MHSEARFVSIPSIGMPGLIVHSGKFQVTVEVNNLGNLSRGMETIGQCFLEAPIPPLV